MLEIITNNHPRELISFYDLTEKEREDFDYVSEEEHYSPRFFRYRGNVYDISEFTRAPNDLLKKGWDGIHADSFFSAVIVHYIACEDMVIVGRCYS